MINATATATEVLKALVLPGVGRFTIVDGHKISGEDLGNNFFLDKGAFFKLFSELHNKIQIICILQASLMKV